jgi:hypothetical protein
VCVVSSARSSCHPSLSLEIPPRGVLPSRHQRATPYVAPPVTAAGQKSLGQTHGPRPRPPHTCRPTRSRPRCRRQHLAPPLTPRPPVTDEVKQDGRGARKRHGRIRSSCGHQCGTRGN